MSYMEPGFPRILCSLFLMLCATLIGAGAGNAVYGKQGDEPILSRDTGRAVQRRYVIVSQDGNTVHARDGDTGKVLFDDSDALRVLEWAMMNSRITVLGAGTYGIKQPIAIPRSSIALVIDQNAVVQLDTGSIQDARPSKPRVPVIYNQGHDNVTVVNLGMLMAQSRKAGRGIFFDGRSQGKHGIHGGCIVDAGIDKTGQHSGASFGRGSVELADCADVEVPLLLGDGYRIYQITAEGCKDLKIGTIVAAPHLSNEPVVLEAMNHGTRVKRVIGAMVMGQSGVLVRSSPATLVDQVQLYGDPLKYIKPVYIHEYGPTGKRFTQRPFIASSEGSRVLKETIVNRKIRSWPQSVELLDFPDSLPRLKMKFKLSAVCMDGAEEPVVDKAYDLSLLTDEEYARAPGPIFLFAENGTARARRGESGNVLFENVDSKEVIEWAMANSPITVLQKGIFTVGEGVVVPRENISLIINEEAELRQDPEIIPGMMPGGRGGYRTLIHNPGHDNVKIINMGTLRAYDGRRGVAIHFDGRSEGGFGLSGGLIFSTGMMYADDVVWVVDSRDVEVPLLIGRGYGNSPLALEGVEDMKIGTVCALMGDEAFENEAMDFNSFCQRVRVGLVIGTTPAEEMVDINNSRDCIIEELCVYRSPGDVRGVQVDDWPESKQDRRDLVTLMPLVHHSEGTALRSERKVEKHVVEWEKSVEVSPLAQTLPRIEMRTRVEAVFEDETKEVVLNEAFEFDI